MKLLNKLIIGILFLGIINAQANLHSYPGPNCLNTALVYAKILKYPRYTSNQETLLYLESRLCHEVSLVGKRQKNDIQIIIDKRPLAQKGVISHAYVYLSPEVMFEKIGYAVEAGYRFMKEDEIQAEYDVDFKNIDVKSFRCQKLESKELVAVEELEKELFYYDNFFDSEKFIKKLNDVVDSAETISDSFIKNVIYQRALSLVYQLGVVDRKYQSEKVNQLIFSKATNAEIKKALSLLK